MKTKHPLQMLLEANNFRCEAYTSPLNAHLTGIGVQLDGLHKVGALIVTIMEDVAASLSSEEEWMRVATKDAITKMSIDVYPYPRGVVAWFPVPFVGG